MYKFCFDSFFNPELTHGGPKFKVSRDMTRILTVSCKSHHPFESLNYLLESITLRLDNRKIDSPVA